jgi:hypothetical protein
VEPIEFWKVDECLDGADPRLEEMLCRMMTSGEDPYLAFPPELIAQLRNIIMGCLNEIGDPSYLNRYVALLERIARQEGVTLPAGIIRGWSMQQLTEAFALTRAALNPDMLRELYAQNCA